MAIGEDTFAYRRHLPHLIKRDKDFFVTFRTRGRLEISPAARGAVLEASVALHQKFCWLECITIMPDHGHVILSPYEYSALCEVMKRLKGRSAFFANEIMGRRGPLWQHESFDHILRNSESIREKMEYICNNPVRAGLAKHWRDYPWTWRACDHPDWPAKAGPHTS